MILDCAVAAARVRLWAAVWQAATTRTPAPCQATGQTCDQLRRATHLMDARADARDLR
jgi:hypothetical protein